MMSGHRSRVGVWLGVLGGALASAQGCILSGDASLGNDGTSAGTGGADAGGPSKAGNGATPSGGKSGSGGKSATGGATVVPSAGEGGAQLGTAGEMADGGRDGDGACGLPIEVGPCDAAIPRFAYSAGTGKCEPFVYGGCEGNANNFQTQTACQAACEMLDCPDHLLGDTVYLVLPLNRPERACVVFDEPILVSCSILLNPSLTVPTGYGEDFCVRRDGALYFAGTLLPKADGWEDCSPGEAEIVAAAPDCNDL
jgi:hypothetical protein